MKKTILLMALGIVLLASPVFAQISEGQVITQNQLDNANITSFNLQCQYLNREFGARQVTFNFDCLSIEPITEGVDYLVIRQPIPVSYSLKQAFKEILSCVAEGNGLGACYTILKQDIVKPFVLFHFRKDKLEIREHIKSFQTDPTLDDGDFDIDFGGEDL